MVPSTVCPSAPAGSNHLLTNLEDESAGTLDTACLWCGVSWSELDEALNPKRRKAESAGTDGGLDNKTNAMV
jgi:hypothetical protein